MEIKNLGIISWLITRASKDKPFQSESLDALAEVMHVKKVLKKSKFDRYYKTRTLCGGLSFLDRVFFDAKYFEMLLPDEVLVVGAHVFTHLNRRHGLQKFVRLILPAIIIGALVGILAFFNFELIDFLPFLDSLGKVWSGLVAGAFSVLVTMTASTYINAKWLRKQETDCDLSSVEFLNGESMVSALIKLNEIRPNRIQSRIIPKL